MNHWWYAAMPCMEREKKEKQYAHSEARWSRSRRKDLINILRDLSIFLFSLATCWLAELKLKGPDFILIDKAGREKSRELGVARIWSIRFLLPTFEKGYFEVVGYLRLVILVSSSAPTKRWRVCESIGLVGTWPYDDPIPVLQAPYLAFLTFLTPRYTLRIQIHTTTHARKATALRFLFLIVAIYDLSGYHSHSLFIFHFIYSFCFYQFSFAFGEALLTLFSSFPYLTRPYTTPPRTLLSPLSHANQPLAYFPTQFSFPFEHTTTRSWINSLLSHNIPKPGMSQWKTVGATVKIAETEVE